MIDGNAPPDVTIIMVSYNTRDITLRAIETLLQNAGDVAMRVVVWDNASADGSADAIAAHFPEIELIRSEDNLGFALANNKVAESATSEWLLLLNPDTETHPKAIENILAFAKAHPRAGIVGGRTVFPDGSLNIGSCYKRMTLWSVFCWATGLAFAFPQSSLFNSEAIGGWKRDSVRHVDIVVGCFLLIPTRLWRELGGFNPRYFMYGEDADLCLRARKLGYRPMITPDAEIMHIFGASSNTRHEKIVRLMRGKATIIRDHWRRHLVPVGIALLWLWIANRRVATVAKKVITGKSDGLERWQFVWAQRHDWLKGY